MLFRSEAGADTSAEPYTQTTADAGASATTEATATTEASPETPAETTPPPPPAPKAPPKPVVAVRGDDRPGQKRPELPAQGGRGRDGKPGAKGAPGAMGGKAGSKFGDKKGGGRDREDAAPRGPRLGDAAFRAQRFAIENAQDALRRLAEIGRAHV